MKDFRVRAARTEDLPGLELLYAANFRQAMEPPRSPSFAAEQLALIKRSGELFVVEHAGSILGSCTIYLCATTLRSARPFAVVEHVAVDFATRRQGVGSKLMQHAIEFAQQHRCYKIMLATGAQKDANHAFYRACGFDGNKTAFEIRW